MASKLAGWIDEAAGAAMIAAGVVAVWFCPPLAPYLISAGAGLVATGTGTLIAAMGAARGIHTLARNPMKSWDVVYGRARVAGTNIYTSEWGNNNKYIDIVAVLACHPCQDVYALLFNGRMVQIDTTAVPSGVPASTWPAINGGTSFTPVQETQNISSIVRSNNVVTVQTKNFPLMVAGEYVIISGVTADPTLNGTFPIAQITSQIPLPSPGSMTFTYICGGANRSIGAQGTVKSTWVDYGRHVYIETMMGNQTPGTTFVGMTIGTPNEGDPTDLQHPPTNPWTANCSAVGRTVVFLRLNYDSTIFANGIPEISFLVHGKNNILDPRPSPVTTVYTENSALCFADYMVNQDYGYRCAYGNEIDIDDLITDANICDETVALAAGGTEPTYTCNGQFELSMTRGEILQHMLSSCGGRLTYSAGQFRCNPAAWAGTSVTLTPPAGPIQIASGPFRWKPKLSVHDLFNAVKGTFVSPLTNWQQTDFPPYMQDSIHGYSSPFPYGDALLAADDGERRYLDIQLPFTISVATAQRLAKLELMRRRQQGTGTFSFNLSGVQMTTLDVIAVTLPFFSWVGKLLEISAWRFTLTSNGGAVALGTEIDVQETDPSVYAWNPGTEELTPQGYPYNGTVSGPPSSQLFTVNGT
jgi:hypothetical protein